MDVHGVGESLASLVLRARLILLRSSRDAGGVGGPRAHASRIASTSAFSAAKFRSACAACGGSDRSSVVGLAGRALLTGAAHGFAHAVDGNSFLSLVSGSGMVMMNFPRPTTSQNVSRASRALLNVGNVDKRLGFWLSLQRRSPPRSEVRTGPLRAYSWPSSGNSEPRTERRTATTEALPKNVLRLLRSGRDLSLISSTGPFYESKSPDSSLSVFRGRS